MRRVGPHVLMDARFLLGENLGTTHEG
jgi:hypothetical protein